MLQFCKLTKPYVKFKIKIPEVQVQVFNTKYVKFQKHQLIHQIKLIILAPITILY